MTTNKKVTLPNEEGEWEPVGYEFQGEPGADGTVTVKEWPGTHNVRVYRRVEKKAVCPQLQLHDVVYVRQGGRMVITGNDSMTNFAINEWGVEERIFEYEILSVRREGKEIYLHPDAPA